MWLHRQKETVRRRSSPGLAESARFWRRHALAPAVVFVVLAAAFQLFPLDRALAGLLYDRADHRWRWGATWWADGLIHRDGQYLVVLIGLVALTCWATSFFSERFRPLRRAAGFAVLSIGLGTGLVAFLKAHTNVDCPRDIDLYGGDRPFVGLFQARPAGLPRGRCFPGGHSSGGFSMFGLYFLLLPRSRRLSRAAPAVSLALGLVFAFGQWVRGAHFASHDLWSAFLCWFVALSLYALVFRFRIWEPSR